MMNREQNYKFRTVSKLCHDKNCKMIVMANNTPHFVTDLVINANRDNKSTKIIINSSGDAIINKQRVSDKELEKILEEMKCEN